MRLKKIVLNGFKSFADKTEFKFDSPITAIVGPNGCGKSNVVDAVKWVLGEQSTKSLRSDQMADVIFSGSSSRKAMGSAEVSLVLTNTSGKLPIEADEVQISRRIFQTGESEYRINNKLARLKDIRQMFLDTGIGVKAYAIIEQGQVERLLTASKQQRREIFEEAAGISKYKAQKKEALRKLDKTEQNLLRLADILAEVQKQLRSVKLQAGKARNYLAYSERLKELQVSYSLVEYDKIRNTTSEKKAELNEIEEQFAELASQLAQHDYHVSNLGREISETEHNINFTDNALVSVQSKIEQHLQRIEFLRNKIEEENNRKEQSTAKIQQLIEHKQVLENDLKEAEREKDSFNSSVEEKRELLEVYGAELDEVSHQCASLEADLEDEKSGILDIVRRTAQLHNEVQSISVQRENLNDQKEKLHGKADLAKAELEELLTEKARHSTRLKDIEDVLFDLNGSLENKRQQREELQEIIADDKETLSEYKEKRSGLDSQLSIFNEMEANLEGLSSGVKDILNAKSAERGKFEYVDGVLADVIASDVENASIVEAALEGRTDAVVVSDSARLLEDEKSLEDLKGRVDFICLDNSGLADTVEVPKEPRIKGRVIDLVSTDERYRGLVDAILGRTLLVDGLKDALELCRDYPGQFEFITNDGKKVLADGTIKIGSMGKKTGLISRKSQIARLSRELEKVGGLVLEKEEEIKSKISNEEHLGKLCQELRTAIYEASTEKTQVNSKLGSLEQNIGRLSEEQPLITNEIEALEDRIQQSVQKEYDSKQKLEELESVNEERQGRIEELEAQVDELRSRRNEKSDELTELRIELSQMTEQVRSAENQIRALENQISHSTATMNTSKQDIENSERQISESERNILESEGVVSELYLKKEQHQDKSRGLHDRLEELLKEKEEAERIIRDKRSAEDEIESRLNQLKIELGQLEVKEQSLIERVQDELQLNLVESYEKFKQEEQDEDSDVDWDAVKEEINELRGKIERLGNVNIDAIDEQEELEKRDEFLTNQVEDLNKSQGQLEQLINRLNKESRDKFAETFEQIRKEFQQLFRKLFGGGKADIILEDAEDILEAGIEVIAKPPGKESRSISLLSGGEKTMTAIALLFSVFKAKPSPFCILDEVDAALDEANNERFNLIIEEFKDTSQFIVVTHSKRTMSVADILYGITMQTRGVSKKISVRFDEDEEDEENVAVA